MHALFASLAEMAAKSGLFCEEIHILSIFITRIQYTHNTGFNAMFHVKQSFSFKMFHVKHFENAECKINVENRIAVFFHNSEFRIFTAVFRNFHIYSNTKKNCKRQGVRF